MCVFTGLPAGSRELSGKLPAGRIGRNQMPLLQGDDAINFFTGGAPGLPIAPQMLLALQFMPMGCAKVGVGLLAVHADSEELTYEFSRSFLRKNSSDVLQAQVAHEDKLPSAPRALRTLLVEELLRIEERRLKEERKSERASSITAYNFNNGKSPKLAIYHLPLQITRFLRGGPDPDLQRGVAADRRTGLAAGSGKVGQKDGACRNTALQLPLRGSLHPAAAGPALCAHLLPARASACALRRRPTRWLLAQPRARSYLLASGCAVS